MSALVRAVFRLLLPRPSARFASVRLLFWKDAEYMARAPVGQVVRLVDEKQPLPRPVEEPPQMHHRVEEIAVIPDDQITPFAQIQPQFKGTDLKAFCRVGQGLPGKLPSPSSRAASASFTRS